MKQPTTPMVRLLQALFVLFAPPALAQTPAEEVAAITQTLTYYLDGGTNRDAATVAKAFHPDAQMLGLRDGQPATTPIREYLSNIKPGEKQQRTTRIETIQVTGNAAGARVESEYSTFVFIDYFNLLKTTDGWKIVNKTFVRIEKK